MIERNLIAFCSGGLCNRLRGLSSAIFLAKQYNRKLLVYWINEPHCQAPFNDLFDNKFNLINAKDLISLGYTDYQWSDTLHKLKVRHRELSVTYSWHKEKEFLSTDKHNVILMSNNFINGIENESITILKTFRPAKDIRLLIDKYTKDFNLDKDTIGVHARGTDMPGVSYEYYSNQIKQHLSHKIFIATESNKFAERFKYDFPNVSMVPLQIFAEKERPEDHWHLNLIITNEACKSAVIDLYLLSKTNLKIFFPASSFAECAKLIGQ